jgi:RNA polymerase sigma factor (sigma-70 family)
MKKDLTSEEILWLSFLKGDTNAFSEIYNNNYKKLFLYGIKLLKDEGLTKDCIHDLFVKLYANRKQLSATNNIHAYLLRSLRNIILNVIRDNKPTEELTNASFDLIDANDEIEDLFSNNDIDFDNKKKLIRIVDSLSDKQKEIIHLRYVQELDYVEIAKTLEINYQSAKNLLHRTLVKIRSEFSK